MSEVVSGDPVITAGNNEAPTDHDKRLSPQSELHFPTATVAEKVRNSLARLGAELKPHYDFIVCGSGSSGSVVAGRLAENADVSVLLLEAGGTDDVPSVIEAGQCTLNVSGSGANLKRPAHSRNARDDGTDLGTRSLQRAAF